MVKVGLIAFANDGGLGAQTRRLAQMLNPDRVLVIDSSGFSPNRKQHFDWYKPYNHFICTGFPSNSDVKAFLPGLTHIFTVENPYNFGLVYWGQEQGAKIYCQTNYEFCDNLDKPWLPVPDKFLMPSYWKLEEMEKRFGKDRVMHLPPPIDPEEFANAAMVNLNRTGKKRFLHVIGTLASRDRNGTLDLLQAVKLSKSDFELVIRTQHPLPVEYFLDDPRVAYEYNSFEKNEDLYYDFDALFLPRRWGGLSLTTNEALMSALPVYMTDISPNNNFLNSSWLVKAEKKEVMQTRAAVDVYSVDIEALAKKLDEVASLSDGDMVQEKIWALTLGESNFSMEVIKPQYQELIESS